LLAGNDYDNGNHDMPWLPDHIAGVMLYLCGGRTARDIAMARMEFMSTKEQKNIIIASGRRYRFGKMMCTDMKERWCIDYDDEWEVAAAARSKELVIEGEWI
jgi:hypothetical protein